MPAKPEWEPPVPTTQPAQEEQEEEKTSNNNDDKLLLCNCYSYVKEVYEDLPNTRTILNNIGDYGEVAVFYYPTSGVHHYAVVVDRKDGKITIDETNFKHCQFTRRVISEDYPNLLGFFST